MLVAQMKAYFETYQLFFKDNLPQLYAHFTALHITPDIYIIDWSVIVDVISLTAVVGSFVIVDGFKIEHVLYSLATHLENLEKSGNLRVVRENVFSHVVNYCEYCS